VPRLVTRDLDGCADGKRFAPGLIAIVEVCHLYFLYGALETHSPSRRRIAFGLFGLREHDHYVEPQGLRDRFEIIQV